MTNPWTQWLARLQIVLIVVLILSVLAVRFEWTEFRPAFMTFINLVKAMMVLGGISLACYIFAWWKKRADLRPAALLAFAIGAVPIVAVLLMVGQNLKVPAIHNITTDLQDPPVFVDSYALRTDKHNSLDVPSSDVREQQQAYYSELAPLVLDLPVDQVYARAIAQCEQFGWSVTAADAAQGRIEAVEQTLVFGFKDDVVIRITAQGQGSRVDMRSVSRIGRSDLGANAKRIKRFLTALKQ